MSSSIAGSAGANTLSGAVVATGGASSPKTNGPLGAARAVACQSAAGRSRNRGVKGTGFDPGVIVGMITSYHALVTNSAVKPIVSLPHKNVSGGLVTQTPRNKRREEK